MINISTIGTIDIWSLQKSNLNTDLQHVENLLDADEKTRAARFKFPRDRQMFVCAHNALRILLAAYTGTPAEKIIFAAGPHKKPFLPGSDIRFSLSHSGEHILIGVSLQTEIGVDTEAIRKTVNFSIARRFFTQTENDFLQAAPASQQKNLFFRLWAGKEAVIKMTGSGLSGSLQTFTVDPTRDRQFIVSEPGWTADLMHLALADGYASALALASKITEVRYGHASKDFSELHF